MLIKKSDTYWYHSSRKTSWNALFALQQSHILPMSKSLFSVPYACYVVNVQPVRPGCSILPPGLFNASDLGCSTAAT